MIKRLILSATAILSLLPLHAASGEWKLHNTFDAFMADLADSPSRTYMLAYGQEYDPAATGMYRNRIPFLFVYDKEADELSSLNKFNELNDNTVTQIRYNRAGKYLFVGYDNGNIDLLADDGTVRNIPGLLNATLNNTKSFNNICFDTAESKIYAATSFGYIVINDKNAQITDSRIFNESIESIGHIGDYIILFTGQKAYCFPESRTVLSISEMTPLPSIDGAKLLMPLGGDAFGFVLNGTLQSAGMGADAAISDMREHGSVNPKSISTTSAGYYIPLEKKAIILSNDRTVKTIDFSAEDKNALTSTWDGTEFWIARPRKGLASMRKNDSGWTLTRDNMMPNASSLLYCTSMANSSKYGLLASTFGHTWKLRDVSKNTSVIISSYINGEWKSFGLPYVSPQYAGVMNNPRGLEVDPDNPALLYFGSYNRGLLRINLDDPDDVQHYSYANDGSNKLPGFHAILPGSERADFAAPKFDYYGNLWTKVSYAKVDGKLWAWPSAERRANNPDGIVKLKIPAEGEGNIPDVWPLRSSGNRNMVIVRGGAMIANTPIYVYDHNGTLSDDSDDRIATMKDLHDQDGGAVSQFSVYECYEEPDTGTVWVCSENGVFTFNPRNVFTDPHSVRRIKVSRNDGTNLADFLLSGSRVFDMTVDSRGHKWFATDAGGVVETSADGSVVLNEFTADNSLLPSNLVYTIEYNRSNNSIMACTEKGFAEYFIQGTGETGNADEVRIYPNPVRPDYFGWVTIDGVADNSLVKITDSAGNLVKELGRAENGTVQWDATNHQQKRVRSGIYFVLSSGGDTGEANVGKIVVVN